MTIYAENRKARFNYQILETIEAGIELKGFEVKAVKTGKASIAGAFATLRGNEMYLTNADLPPYQPKNTPPDYDSKRPRRLLLKREEIARLIGQKQSAGLTIVPLKLYNKGGLVKVELGLARGKKKSDKRETLKKRAAEREIRPHLNTNSQRDTG